MPLWCLWLTFFQFSSGAAARELFLDAEKRGHTVLPAESAKDECHPQDISEKGRQTAARPVMARKQLVIRVLGGGHGIGENSPGFRGDTQSRGDNAGGTRFHEPMCVCSPQAVCASPQAVCASSKGYSCTDLSTTHMAHTAHTRVSHVHLCMCVQKKNSEDVNPRSVRPCCRTSAPLQVHTRAAAPAHTARAHVGHPLRADPRGAARAAPRAKRTSGPAPFPRASMSEPCPYGVRGPIIRHQQHLMAGP